MVQRSSYTSTDLLAAACDVLARHGYKQAKPDLLEGWPVTTARLFEDPYGIVAVVVYETWAELMSHWTDAQAALVDVMSQRVNRTEAKAWDGYLVLLTPGVLESGSESRANAIRYDTSRVRKLVASGDELTDLVDVERVLLPVLPIRTGISPGQEPSALAVLPEILSQKGIPRDAADALIEAFSKQDSMMERLHAIRTPQ